MTKHRPKISEGPRLPFSILVHRPVSRSEYLDNPKAMEAYWKEWSNLEARETWDWSSLTGWNKVAREARANNQEIHFGYLFGIMVE